MNLGSTQMWSWDETRKNPDVNQEVQYMELLGLGRIMDLGRHPDVQLELYLELGREMELGKDPDVDLGWNQEEPRCKSGIKVHGTGVLKELNENR